MLKSKAILKLFECKANTFYKEDLQMVPVKRGKVRDIYEIGGDKLIIVTTDRISAFDVILQDEIPGKGMILTKMSKFWFDYIAEKSGVKNHMISVSTDDMPEEFQTSEFDGCSMLVKKLKMLPIECIVRGYITGSGWESYKETGNVCGIKLPKGLQESQQLPEPIYTPTTKAEEGHDEHITYEQTVELLGETVAKTVKEMSINIYSLCANYARENGIIIADTKFEFGQDEEGNIVIADEVLTPDSSRFWPADKYEVGKPQESFDKQFVRDYLNNCGWDKKSLAPKLPEDVIKITSDKYIEAYEVLTGKEFI